MRYCVLLACVAVGCGEAVPEETPDAAVARDAGRDAGAAVKDAGVKPDAGQPQVDGGGEPVLAVTLRWKSLLKTAACTPAPPKSDTVMDCEGFQYRKLSALYGLYGACTATVDGPDAVLIDCRGGCTSQDFACGGGAGTVAVWTCDFVPYTSSCTWSPP